MKKRLAFAGGIAGGILAALGTAALAFILVTGVGSSTADAYQVKDLVVTHNTPVLIPGQKAMVPITVTNPNVGYPIKITDIDASVKVQGPCHIEAIVVPASVSASRQDNVGSGPGVPPTGGTTIHGRVFVSQDKADTKSCAYTLTVTVEGELGNG